LKKSVSAVSNSLWKVAVVFLIAALAARMRSY